MKVFRRRKISRESILVFGLVVFFLLAALTQANVHFSAREYILNNAKNTKRFWVKRKDSAYRGTIYSSDSKVLAQSTDVYEFGIDYTKVPKSTAFFLELSAAVQISASELRQAALTGTKNATWNTPIGRSKADEVRRVKVKWNADGISLHRVSNRTYPMGEYTSGIIGYIRENKPVTGIEFSKNDILSGNHGYREGMVDRTGAFLPMRMSEDSVKPEHGSDVQLTINSHLQEVATRCIRDAVEEYNAEYGAVIIMDPATGDVLSMANWPAWIPEEKNTFSTTFSDYNPCYMSAFEPGSTFKCLTLAKALDLHHVRTDDKFHCVGELKIGKSSRVRCHLRASGRAHGTINAVDGIARSCNTMAASWGIKIGYNNMVEYLEQLGLLEKSQLGLPNERKGMFNRNDYAKALQMANVGFGQSITATPIALTSAFSLLANKGIRMEPRLIKSVGGKENSVKVASQVISEDSAEKVLNAMEQVIESNTGTGKRMRIPGYKLAGKTGTAQKVNKATGKLQGGGYIANFVGFVPSRNPKVTVMVMVDNPRRGGIYGGVVAGPIFHNIAKEIIKHYKILPNEE